MNFAADLLVLMQDLGVHINANGQDSLALVDAADEVLHASGNAPMIGRGVIATIRTGSPALKVGDALTLDGVSYRATEVLQIEDGKLTRVLCSKATR